MKPNRLDALFVYDPRFTGGTASAILTDAYALHDAGMDVGFLEVESSFFSSTTLGKNPDLAALSDLDGAKVVKSGAKVSVGTTFFHHPLTFSHAFSEIAEIHTNVAILVAHHPPFRGDGSLEYDPMATIRAIEKAFGTRPMYAPVSGVIRKHLSSFLPFVRLASEDWVNAFDTQDWKSTRPIFETPIATVGRHSREDPLKWPDSAADIMSHVAPPEAGWATKVMGCPTQHLLSLGVDIDRWEMVPFNGEPVEQFIDSLDVFSYFHSARWVEAFGRTILEAMLMERPCVLAPSLQDTFGDLALYAAPAEVHDLMHQLRNNSKQTRERCERVRARAARQYASTAIPKRLKALEDDRGSSVRSGRVQVPPLQTVRKLIGLKRRQRNTTQSNVEAKF